MRDYYAGRGGAFPSTIHGGPDAFVATAIATAGDLIGSAIEGGDGGGDFKGDWGGTIPPGGISPQEGLNGKHHPGPYTPLGVAATIKHKGMDDPAVRDLAAHVWGSCEFTGECGPAVPSSVKRDPRKLANAAVFVAHGGVNGDMVRYERKAVALLDAVMNSGIPASTSIGDTGPADPLDFLKGQAERWWENQKDLAEDTARAAGSTLAGGIEGQEKGQRTGSQAGTLSAAGISPMMLAAGAAVLFLVARS